MKSCRTTRPPPPVQDQVQVIEQDVHDQDEGHDPEAEKERNQVESEDVGMEDTHGCAAYPTGRATERPNSARNGFDHRSLPCYGRAHLDRPVAWPAHLLNATLP